MNHDLGEWKEISGVKIRTCKKVRCQASEMIVNGKSIGSALTHKCKTYFGGGGKIPKNVNKAYNVLELIGNGRK